MTLAYMFTLMNYIILCAVCVCSVTIYPCAHTVVFHLKPVFCKSWLLNLKPTSISCKLWRVPFETLYIMACDGHLSHVAAPVFIQGLIYRRSFSDVSRWRRLSREEAE